MAKQLATEQDDLPTAVDRPIILTREQIRAAMFSDVNAKPKVINYEFLSQKLEWRCPTLKEMQEARDAAENENLMVRLIINHSYIPGTEEKVFEDGDYKTIMNMPLSGSFNEAVQAISAVINLKVEDKLKN